MKWIVLFLVIIASVTAVANNIAIIELSYDGSSYNITQIRKDIGFAPIPPPVSRGIPLTVTTDQGISQTLFLPLERLAEGSSENSTTLSGGYVPLEPYKTVRIVHLPPSTKSIIASLQDQEVKVIIQKDASLLWIYVGGVILLSVLLIVLYRSRKTM